MKKKRKKYCNIFILLHKNGRDPEFGNRCVKQFLAYEYTDDNMGLTHIPNYSCTKNAFSKELMKIILRKYIEYHN